MSYAVPGTEKEPAPLTDRLALPAAGRSRRAGGGECAVEVGVRFELCALDNFAVRIANHQPGGIAGRLEGLRGISFPAHAAQHRAEVWT